jgi:nucleoid DNA-binding protein
MTINREKLIQLLVEKTGLSKADAETQLDELTSRILDAASRGKALEIKDFGLFYFDEDGQLCFKASDQLDTEINYQYSGMEPVELKPANKFQTPAAKEDKTEETEPQKPEEIKKETEKTEPRDKSDIYGIGRTLAGKSESDGPETDEPGTEGKSDPFEKLFQNPSAEIKPRPEEIRKAGTSPKKETAIKDNSSGSVKKKSRNPMTMIIVIILGFVVLTVGYLLLSEYLEAPEPAATETTETVPLDEPPAEAEADVTETEEPAEQEEVVEGEEMVADDTETDNADGTVTTPEEERYGLHGNYVEASGDEFTIVVHSLPNRRLAEETAEELRQEGFRTTVTERVVNDRVVFRVGIGQFETLQSALSESETLPEPYRNQNFIHRIQ